MILIMVNSSSNEGLVGTTVGKGGKIPQRGSAASDTLETKSSKSGLVMSETATTNSSTLTTIVWNVEDAASMVDWNGVVSFANIRSLFEFE